MREILAQQINANAQEMVGQLRNRANLRRFVAGLFAEEGGLAGFTAWAQDIARQLQGAEERAAPPPPPPERRALAPDAEDMNVEDEPEDDEPPAPRLRPVPRPEPVAPQAEVDFPALLEMRLSQFQQALPAMIEAAVRQQMTMQPPPPPQLRPSPVPIPTVSTPGPYDRNARPAFVGTPGWPYNGGR